MDFNKNYSISRILLILSAIIGVFLMGYLTNLHYSEETGSFCNLGEGFSCDIVNKSIYSEIFGIPVAVLGLLYFLGVLLVGLFKYNRSNLKKVAFLSIVFLGPSLYLTATEIFFIESICVFCEISKVVILGIIIISIIAIRPEKLEKNIIISAILLALILVVIMHFIYSSSGPGEKYNEFAQCLTNEGFKMYGSIYCSFCARQKEKFGDAFKFIKEIECDPRVEINELERCLEKNIEKTPTWIKEDSEGNEITRMEAGLRSLEDLSNASGCSLPRDI